MLLVGPKHRSTVRRRWARWVGIVAAPGLAVFLGACVRDPAPVGPGPVGPDPVVPDPVGDTDDSAGATTGTDPTAPGVDVAWTASGPIACEDPSSREEARFDVLESFAEPPKLEWFWGAGAVVADFTGDARLDLVLPGFWTTFFYRGDAGGFVPDPALLGLGLVGASGGSSADYDGDGDQDLLVTRFLESDVLLRNDGGAFVDVTAEAGLLHEPTRSVASSWADYDQDGDLDLFVGCYGFLDQSEIPHSEFLPADPNWLFANDGDGTFTDVSATLPQEAHDGYTLAGGFHDLDGDRLPELYIVNDFGEAFPNVLLRNRGGGVLELDGNEAGLDLALTFMGLGLGDTNGDEVPDMVMPAWKAIRVLESSGSLGYWSDWSGARGVVYDEGLDQKVGWGAELVDMDNDGDLDMPVAFGFLAGTYENELEQPDALWLREGDDYVDRAAEWGLAGEGVGRGFVAADVDDDGWIDLIKRDLAGPTTLHLSRCGAESWLRVRLHAPSPNTSAIGAKVVAVTGDERRVAWIHAGGTNHASAGPPEAHFGLGAHEVVDRVEVTWPDGAVSSLDGVQARQILDVTRL